MDYKLDYISRLFAKISKKRIETYVIARIWNQLDNDKVQFVTQQYIRRTQDKYAMADLYLPQINLFIEINEEFHKNNEEVDRVRNEEIVNVTHAEVKIIDCDTPLESIHLQITEVVELIRRKIDEQGEKFKPWEGDNTLSVEYHQKKGYLSANEKDSVRTIDEAFAIFNVKAKHRGFLRVSGVALPYEKNTTVWCPNSNHRIWGNELSEDELTIYEYNKTDEKERTNHVNHWINHPHHRITFFRGKDELGFCFYRFVGVFEIDRDKSLKENKCVWKRIEDYYKLYV
ncbi:AbaSI family restriction endonuclease [Bacteroides sp. 51]|uniref:AbaSI family restriction endonuclease n=1 Tax=Bacteroides sp. 51 TaxID=2302938 RepID=UPI0013D29F2C|nr:hypothetical protein [Bacteroides sp. 51]NDV82474.1 hypothetical protein [Bacteroides sp. 51]